MEAEAGTWAYAEDSRITPSYEGNQAIQGVTAGMAEMLLQSSHHCESSEAISIESGLQTPIHRDKLRTPAERQDVTIALLPALPKAWPKGEVSGLRAKGGYDVAMSWKDGALDKARIHAHYAGTCRLRTKTPVKVFLDKKEIPCKQIEDNLIEFEVKAGEKFIVIKK
jgi:alpha-L-fucosidase 2